MTPAGSVLGGPPAVAPTGGHPTASPLPVLRPGRLRARRAASSVAGTSRAASWQAAARLGCLALLVVLAAPAARAQAVPAVASASMDSARVDEVRLEGPGVIPEETLRGAIRTQPNRRFLGVPGATWWLWLYRTGENPRLGRLGDALQAVGEPPARVDRSVVVQDAERLALLLRQEGYRRATVEARIDSLGPARVRVVFRYETGPVARWRRVLLAFVGAEPPARDLAERLARASLLAPDAAPRPDTAHGFSGFAFRPSSDRYSETVLVEERRRLIADLREAGYAAAGRDSVRALVYPLRPDSSAAPDSAAASGDRFDLVLRVSAGPRVRVGGVEVRIAGPEDDAPARIVRIGDPPLDRVIALRGERRLAPAFVAGRLDVVPGDRFRQSALVETKRRLDATGVFSFTDVAPVWRDTVRLGGDLYLPLRLDLRTRPRHTLRAETFAQQRAGGDTDAQLGTGLAVTYENANLFGRAEALRVRAGVQGATDPGVALFGSREADLSVSLTTPYAAFPLQRLGRVVPLGVRTTAAASLQAARREELRLIVRGRATGRLRYELPHSPATSSLVDVVDVALSNPDTLAGFTRVFLDRLPGGFTGPERERLLEDYTRPQVTTLLRYTLRHATVHPLRRDAGRSFEASFSVGGYLEALADRFVFTPDETEGTVPGPGGGALVYRPHLRVTADGRRFWTLRPGRVVAAKAAVGVAFATGPSGLVPFDQRFFAGGATSVRGWGLRELGPGAVPAGRGQVLNVAGGDIRLELSAEARQTLVRELFGADWIVAAFADAGNVWFGPTNPGLPDAPIRRDGRFRVPGFAREIAVGSGTGLRIAWTYLVVRLDAAVRVADPADPGVLPGGLRPTFHFALGHSF